MFIINVLLWAWLDNKETDTRLKTLLNDCDLLEASFKKIIERRKFTDNMLRRYAEILDKIYREKHES